MILSNDESILERARTLREYDEAPSLQPLSYNYKLTDLQGALGLVQLERFHALLERRAAIAAQYDHALDGANAVRPVIPEGRTHVFYRYVVRIPKLLTNKGKLADLLSRLEHRGVQCRRPVFQALHRYLNVDGFPVTEEVSETAVSIPIYPSMTDDEVKAVARVVREELH